MPLSSVRQFGLRHCDLQTMLTNINFFLRFLTLNIDKRNRKRIPLIFYAVTLISAGCYFYVYLISMSWLVVRYMEDGDTLTALIVLSLGVSSEIGSTKLFFMFLNAEKVRDIVGQCLTSNALVVPNSRFFNNLMKTLRNVKRRAMVFWLVLIGNGVVYIVKPILLPGRHLMEDAFIIYGLEPIFESPNYEIAFVIMSIGVCVTVYLPANITALLIIISGYIEAQMLASSEELLHLWDDAEKEYKQNIVDANSASKGINAFVEQRLKEIVKIHSTNISILHQVEDVFRGAIAVEFFLLTLGLIAELLGGLENTYIEIPFALMQVAMDCLTGQRLIDAGEVFERTVYSCRWEKLDNNNRRIVLVMFQNSQRTMSLTAGGVTMLSFTSLMAVIKSIYSAYTALRSTMK